MTATVCRRDPRRPGPALVACCAATLLAGASAAEAQCFKDTECRGDLVCEGARCVSPGSSSRGPDRPVDEASDDKEPDRTPRDKHCASDADCPGVKICRQNRCAGAPKLKGPPRTPCYSAADCAAGQICSQGWCASASPPTPATGVEASNDKGWAGRFTFRLGSGLSAHGMDNGAGPFFFADLAVGLGLVSGLAIELQYAFTSLRTEDEDVYHGVTVSGQVHGLMAGVRYRFAKGTVVPHLGTHLGVALTRDEKKVGGVDDSLNSSGVALDIRAGIELYLSRAFALDVFAAINLATGVPAATDDDRVEESAAFFFLGAGFVVAP